MALGLIALLRTFAWLRWRLLVNALEGRRRDTMERMARIGALVVLVLAALGFGLGSAALGGLGLVGGWLVGTGRIAPEIVGLFGRIVLLVPLILVLLVPAGRAAYAGSSGATRLMLLPISRRMLHGIEIIASLADPWLLVVVPGLFLLPAGLAFAGAGSAALLALAAAVAVLGVIAALGALVSFLTEWVMRGRRRGEIFTLTAVLVFGLGGMSMALFAERLEQLEQRTKAEARARAQAGEERRPGVNVDRLDRSLPAWTRALPSELYGQALRAGIERRPGPAWGGVGVLFLQGVALLGLSAPVHARLMGDSAASGGGGRRRRRLAPPHWSLAGVSGPVAAVALAQAHTALRSVRGRLAVLMPGPLLAILALLPEGVFKDTPLESVAFSGGPIVLAGGIVFSLYTLSAFHLNQFGSDRAGLSLQFLAPLSDVDLVRGKAIGGAMVLGVAVLICLGAALVVAPTGPPGHWLAVLLGGAATYTLLAPAAACLSALFPAASDLSKTGSGGNPHGLAGLIGMFLVPVAAAPAALILVVGGFRGWAPGAVAGLEAVWLLAAVPLSALLMNGAARVVASRRDNLTLVALGR